LRRYATWSTLSVCCTYSFVIGGTSWTLRSDLYPKHSMCNWLNTSKNIQVDTSVLNLPVEKMDYFVPGWAPPKDDQDDREWRWPVISLHAKVMMQMKTISLSHSRQSSCWIDMYILSTVLVLFPSLGFRVVVVCHVCSWFDVARK
jgi:hypothetical protein